MNTNVRICFGVIALLLIALLCGCGNQAPTVQITQPEDGAVLTSKEVRFAAFAEDPESDPLTYKWRFGDGAADTVQSGSHTYSAGGDYTINLSVSDGKRTVAQAIDVHVNVAPSPEISWRTEEDAEWSRGTVEGTGALELEWDAGASSDEDGRIVSYEWRFRGEAFAPSATATGPKARCSYDTPGTYSVTLRIVDDLGASAEQSVDVVIHRTVAQSLSALQSLESVMSPMRSPSLASMFTFGREVLHIEDEEVIYRPHFASFGLGSPSSLELAMHMKIHGCHSYEIEGMSHTLSSFLEDRKRECESIRHSISPAFAAALAAHDSHVLGCSPETCAKAVLGFEELVALTSAQTQLPHDIRVLANGSDSEGTPLDTTELPSALLQLPPSVDTLLDRLDEELATLVASEQERIDRIAAGAPLASDWSEAGWIRATRRLRCVDESALVDSVGALSAYLEGLNADHIEALREIVASVRDQARCVQDASAPLQHTHQDQLEFGVVFDNSRRQENALRLALVYSLHAIADDERPMAFALFRREGERIVRGLPHVRIQAEALEWRSPDLEFAYEISGAPSRMEIEPFYEIQYERLSLGWVVTSVWEPQSRRLAACVITEIDIHDKPVSAEEGQYALSIPTSRNGLEVDLDVAYRIFSHPLDALLLSMTRTLGSGNCISSQARDFEFSYRIVSPATYP